MFLNQIPALKWYFSLFDYVAQKRLKGNDVEPRDIHTLMLIVIATSILMWAYTLCAYFYISSPVPWTVGFLCSLTHMLSPLLFRFTKNTAVPANVLIFSGMLHQSTFSYYDGGFNSDILVWFPLLPLIAGVVYGVRGAMMWLGISFSVAAFFFIMYLLDYPFPQLITPIGALWARCLLIFGWIFLSSTIVIVYAGLNEHTEQKLHDQNTKIDELFRILFHDLANPLGRITIGLSIAKKQIPGADNNRGFVIAKEATDSMVEITQNIRKMYAASKSSMDLTLTPLNAAIEYILKLYADELQKKEINIDYDFAKNTGLNIMVEPVSFNNQVLGNIISNSIKFSPAGSKISINVYPAANDSFKLEVKDNGIGIPQSFIGQLFDLNKKTTRPGTNGESGTGFGMHIVKSFVEIYGGQLAVESIEGDKNIPSGTTVKLILRGEWV